MAFLCPVRIRSTGNNGTRKKKQGGGDSSSTGGKKRSFLSATVNSIINGDHHQERGDNESDNNNDRTAISGTSPQQQQQQLGPGRITGSSSIETLVRVGLEKEAGIPPEARNMVVLHDFTPCVDDELEVKRGSICSVLYRENDWVYVILENLPNGVKVTEENSKEGFIPHSYCAPYGTPLAEMALCSNNNAGSKGGGRRGERGGRMTGAGGGAGGGSMSDSETIHQMRNHHQQQQQHHQNSQSHHHQPQFLHHGGGGGGRGGSVGRPYSSFDENSSNNSVNTVPFYKDPSPTRYIALYKFTARDENDVNVERGEILTVLNKDDPDWFYVVRSDGQEGFVPSAFVYPLQAQQQHHHIQLPHHNNSSTIPVPSGSGSSQQPTYQQIENDHEYADAHVQSPQSPGGLVLLPGGSSDLSSNQSPSSISPSVSAAQHQQFGAEFIMLYDYKAQAPDDLSVRRGDYVFVESHQTVEGWLWAYAPKHRKYGFIPKAYARPPAMTSL